MLLLVYTKYETVTLCLVYRAHAMAAILFLLSFLFPNKSLPFIILLSEIILFILNLESLILELILFFLVTLLLSKLFILLFLLT